MSTYQRIGYSFPAGLTLSDASFPDKIFFSAKRGISTFLLFILITLLPYPTSARVYISEFMASNSMVLHDNDFYEYSDWIEFFNDDSAEIDISGYSLNDGPQDTGKWNFPEGTTIPAHGVLLVWADGRNTSLKNFHTSFKLSADGETITLHSDGGRQIDSVIFSTQLSNVSMGRNISDISQWVYFGIPTPGVPNGDDGITSPVSAPEVIFSSPGGATHTSFSLELTVPSGIVFYTTDCSTPTRQSTPYTTPIAIDSTMVIRARTFQEGRLPGPVVTRTYIFDYTSTLPVFSVVTDSSHLWDDSSGIYCTGLNGVQLVEEWGREAANYNQPWERPINIEMYDSDGSTCFNQTAGIRIQGEYVRMIAQKPFSIYGRGRYSGAFNYQFFPDKPITTFNNFLLRPGGNDWVLTMFNEGAINSIVSPAMDLDIQAYRPAVLFLNGEYWGLYNIREKINEDYLQHNYGLPTDNVDMLENLAGVIAGSNETWLAFQDDISDRDMSDDSNFQVIEDNIDINEFINYIITEVYFVNTDWPVGNMRFWRRSNGEGKWRWILQGIDLGFNNHFVEYNSLKRIIDTTAMSDQYIITGTILFRKCLENASFKNRFIQLFSHHLSSTFTPARVETIINDLKSVIAPEMPNQIARWKDATDNDILPIPSFEKWNDAIGWMVLFARQRPEIQRSHITEQFKLDSCVNLTIDFPQPKQGVIHLYGTILSDTTLTEQFYTNIPIALTAHPYPGYTFEGWEGISDSATITITLGSDTVLTPVFSSSTGTPLPKNIASDYTLTKKNSPYLIHSECVIDSDVVVICKHGVNILMDEHAVLTVHGALQFAGTAEDNITITAFGQDTLKPWGAIVLENCTAPSILRHITFSDASHGRLPDRQKGALTALNATLSLTHCTFRGNPFPLYAVGSRITVDSSYFSATATGDLINIVDADSAVIRNSSFRGNPFFDTDAIDLDNVRGGLVENNVLFNFTGINSDGIDLGEESENITICGNHIIHCFDKGISIGQASTVHIHDNTITDCSIGIGIKDKGSSSIIINNNFCYNDTDVAAFEKNIGKGGGSAEISNCVFYKTGATHLYTDQYSEITVSYSISKKTLPGTLNTTADPRFFNPAAGDYTIPETSPCRILAPPSPYPVIGTSCRYDLSGNDSLIISEIHFAPRQGLAYKFIELYNPSDTIIDIGGYWLSRAVDFIFPAPYPVGPGECVVVAGDSATYKGYSFISVAWHDGNLDNKGESIILRNSRGELVDYVTYNPTQFPKAASEGRSIELYTRSSDNDDMTLWQHGLVDGSPGVPSEGMHVITTRKPSAEFTFKKGARYAVLHFSLRETGFVEASLHDLKGRLVRKVINDRLAGGRIYSYTIPFKHCAQGVYLFTFNSKHRSLQRKITVIHG